MSDKPVKAPIQAAEQAPEVTVFDQTIEEFCSNLSRSDGRVEMISAFCGSERREGRFKDSAEAYTARYEQFVNAPA